MKKILIVIILIAATLFAGITYLNRVVFPAKIKSLIINAIKEATQKEVRLQKAEFNLFKGLLLRDLVIYDDEKELLSVKECYGTFLIWPLFKKTLIIPKLSFSSPNLLLERRKDGTFNIQQFFPDKPKEGKKAKFTVLINRVNVRDAKINFYDYSLPETFYKALEDIDLALSLSLPASIKFNLKSKINAEKPMNIKAEGEYKLTEKELAAAIIITDLSAKEFHGYFKGSGVTLPQGLIDVTGNLNLKNNIILFVSQIEARGLAIHKEKINARAGIKTDSQIEYGLADKHLNISGKADIQDLDLINLDKSDEPILKGVNAGIRFNLSNPNALKGSLEVSSQGLELECAFTTKDKLINFQKLTAMYLDSQFFATGNVDLSEPSNLISQINAEASLNLKDLKSFSKDLESRLVEVKPEGNIKASFELKGNLNDIISCDIEAKITGPQISFYGLKATDLFIQYNQSNGIGDISSASLFMYEGELNSSGRINLLSQNQPFMAQINLEGLKLEKLKIDTAAKEQSLAGNLQSEVKLNGFFKDLTKLSGSGNILIKDGNLWELNFFKGIGRLLFARDFANIIFRDGYCDFLIQDKNIFTDNLKLSSNITDLTGSVKIGFDGKLSSSLNVQILDKSVPLSGTIKDITTAIIGEAGLFGTIKISGTLKEPKYSFQPAVVSIIKGLKESIFGE
ncbi:MAG: AsmA family protein [Candidatus Omnitrophota bacterium]